MLVRSLSEEFGCEIAVDLIWHLLVEEEEHLVEVGGLIVVRGREEREDALLGMLMVQSTLPEKTIILTIHQYYYSHHSALPITFLHYLSSN